MEENALSFLPLNLQSLADSSQEIEESGVSECDSSHEIEESEVSDCDSSQEIEESRVSDQKLLVDIVDGMESSDSDVEDTTPQPPSVEFYF